MATISSAGIGSGLDVNTIITKLMAIESQPLTNLQTAATTIQTQISEVGKIKSAMSTLQDSASKLASTTFWNQTTGSSSSTAVGVTTSSGAAAASYNVQVTSIAAAQSIASPTFASSTTTLAAGSLHIELGAWGAGQTSFTPKAGATAVDIAVEATDTVASLRDKINAAGAGVSASILTDSTGARLVLTSASTGAANAFRTSVTPAGGSLGGLAFDPSSGASTATQTQAAADAAATINGLAVTSSSNTLANVLDGITLTLNSPTTTAATITVAADTATMKTALQDFAKAYSSVASLVAKDTKYDATNKKAGVLQGDSAITGLLSRMRSVLGTAGGAAAAFPHMSDIGFEQQRDGSLTVNATKLDNALANLPQLKTAFTAVNATDTSLSGFGTRFRALTSDVLGIDGSLSTRSQGLTDRLTRNTNDQDKMQTRLDQTQARLEKQYTALDATMGTLTSLSTYVTQQVAAWNKA
jgi:flagellar hook-associated protein 2